MEPLQHLTITRSNITRSSDRPKRTRPSQVRRLSPISVITTGKGKTKRRRRRRRRRRPIKKYTTYKLL